MQTAVSRPDIDAIRPGFKAGAKLVVVGAGYIGLEVAAVARPDRTRASARSRVPPRTGSPKPASASSTA